MKTRTCFTILIVICAVLFIANLHAGNMQTPYYNQLEQTANNNNILAGNWSVYTYTDGEISPLNYSQVLPEKIKTASRTTKGAVVDLHNDTIDFGHIAGSLSVKSEAWAFKQIELKTGKNIPIAAGADWWMEWFVNGKPVFSTMKNGNRAAVSTEAHTFILPLKTGVNIIAVRVLSGSKGWKLVCKEQHKIKNDKTKFQINFPQLDSAAEYILKTGDDPDLFGVVPVADERGTVYQIKLQAGVNRTLQTYVSQYPHDGFSFWLKGDGSGSTIRIAVRSFMDKSKSDFEHSQPYETLYSRPIALSSTKWEKIDLTYQHDFTPTKLAQKVKGRDIRWFKIICNGKSDGIFYLDDIRYVNSKLKQRFEIRHLLRQSHVFFNDEPFLPSFRFYAEKKQLIKLKLYINRSDNRVNKVITKELLVSKGESVQKLKLPQLPRGYYSVVVNATAEDGTKFNSGAYFIVVPHRKVEAWMGDHEGGAYIYNRYELSDLMRAGYAYLREAGQVDDVSFGQKNKWSTVDAILNLRLSMGFELLWSQMGTDKSNIDLPRFEAMREQLKVEVDNILDYSYKFPAKDPTKIAKNIALAVKRYRGRIKYWEFGNEFDRAVYPGAKHGKFCWWGTGAEYATDLKYFYAGVKAGDPNALVISSGITCFTQLPGRNEFVQTMLDATQGKNFDIFGVHGYGGSQKLKTILAELKRRGIEKPFANTESGYSGETDSPLIHSFKEVLYNKYAGALFFISFINRCKSYVGAGEPQKSGDWGAFHTRFYEGSPAKRWALYSNIAFMLDRATAMEMIIDQPYSGYKFKSREGFCQLLFAGGKPVNRQFSSNGNITLFDMLGNELRVKSKQFQLSLNSMPVFIISSAPISSTAVDNSPITQLQINIFNNHIGVSAQIANRRLRLATKILNAPKHWQFAPAVHTKNSPIIFFPIKKLQTIVDGNFTIGEVDGKVKNSLRRTIIASTPLEKPFVLNGRLNEWGKFNQALLGQSKQVELGNEIWNGRVDPNCYYGKKFKQDNLSGTLRYTTTAKHIHLGVNVIDDEVNIQHGATKKTAFGDHVTVEFYTVGGKRQQLSIIPVIGGDAIILGNKSLSERIKAKWSTTDQGYAMEIALERNIVQVVDGKIFNMNIALTDADRHTGSNTKPYITINLGVANNIRDGILPLFVINKIVQ